MLSFSRRLSDFFFGRVLNRRFAFVFLRKTPTNLVVTLTDLRYKVIFCRSAGSLGGDKKFRRSPYVMEPLFKEMLDYLKLHKILSLKLILRMRVNGQVFSFLNECASRGIAVSRIIERYNLPHNGIRSKRAPRK